MNRNIKHDNLLPIVKFAFSEESLCNTVPTGKEEHFPYFCSQFDSICSKLESLTDESADLNKQYYYQKEAKFARELLKEATDKPQYMRYCNFYNIIIDNWDDLKDWSITFRMLFALATMESGWRNTPESRMELLSLLKQVSDEW